MRGLEIKRTGEEKMGIGTDIGKLRKLYELWKAGDHQSQGTPRTKQIQPPINKTRLRQGMRDAIEGKVSQSLLLAWKLEVPASATAGAPGKGSYSIFSK